MKSDSCQELEKKTKDKYDGGIYKPETICSIPVKDPKVYYDILVNLKLNLIRKYYNNSDKLILDLCCAVGTHLIEISSEIKNGIGLDYSKIFINNAQEYIKQNKIKNLEFIEGDAKQLPFNNNSIDLVYSFSSLYHIPDVETVISEIARVLTPGGRCVIELGNILSLNAIVCRYYPELAQPCLLTVKEMREMILNSGMKIIEHRSFQLLPLWADRPKRLFFLLHPAWTKFMAIRIKGVMLDEWISSFPVIRSFAFRHIFVCEKLLNQ